MFAAISVQKAVRDRAENIPVTAIYIGVAWGMLGASLIVLSIGLWNSSMLLSEKGFYGIGFTMSLLPWSPFRKTCATWRPTTLRNSTHVAPLPSLRHVPSPQADTCSRNLHTQIGRDPNGFQPICV